MSELDEHVEKPQTEVEEYKIPDYFFKPERQVGESFFEYKKRRLLEKFLHKEIKKGQVIWKSIYEVEKGKFISMTYNKSKVAEVLKKHQESIKDDKQDTTVE